MPAATPDNGGVLQIDDALRRRIEDFARRVASSPQDIVRRAFNEYEVRHADDVVPEVDEEESVFDRWKKLGVIGCYDAPDAPSDLSTNKKHMEGFGRD
jgi:hypothetical protein